MGDDPDEQRTRYRELLEELRTVLPGVQVLFAFLLTAPFSNRFEQLDDVGRWVYGGALLGAALSTVLFFTPTSYHRIGPSHDRSARLNLAIRLVIAGTAALVVAITCATFVVTRFIFGTPEALGVAGAVLTAAIALWYVVPLRRRLADRHNS